MAEAPKNIDEVQARMRDSFQPDGTKGFKAVYQFCVSGDGGRDFYAAVDDGSLTVEDGKHDAPSITMSAEHGDFLKMQSGDQAAAQALFMQGKIKVEPMDMALIMRMQGLFKQE